ncbi:MAG: aspartate aminotransferase family protein [Syntrophomonadaceae bacterium]|jgi:putrescine aminotransferase
MKYVTLEEALAFDRNRVIENHKKYGNSHFPSYLALLDFDKNYPCAEGMYVWDADGNRYLDFLGAYGALNLGHNPPAIIAALKKIWDLKTTNMMQSGLSALAAGLGETLAEITPGDLRHSFFASAGCEAVEGALKTARIASGKPVIVSTEASFHGKTFGALSASGREKYKKPFEPLLPGFEQIPFGDTEALEERFKQKDVGAFICECIQGEGGINIPPPGYLVRVRELCDKYGVLWIADEVQTGFGRTGKMFACMHEGVAPDIMVLGKSIGGGVVPLAAFISTPRVWSKAYGSIERVAYHTTTFGGMSTQCAASLAAIQAYIEMDLPGQAADNGEYFLSRLKPLQQKYNMIQEIRGKGLLIGIEFKTPGGIMNKVARLEEVAQENIGAMVSGVLLNDYRIITAYTLHNPAVLRLEPPLTVNREQLDEVVQALDETLSKYKSFASLSMKSAKTMISSRFSPRN